MEADDRGAGGDNGLVPRSAGVMERGNDNQPGTETIAADGNRIRAGGWDHPDGPDRSADSLAVRHDNDPRCKTDCTWRMLAENARSSYFPDSPNGAAAHLCRNCRGVESRRLAQRLWPPLYDSACRIYLPEGRLGWPEAALQFKTAPHSRSWWSSRKLNKRCFVFQVYSSQEAIGRSASVDRILLR